MVESFGSHGPSSAITGGRQFIFKPKHYVQRDSNGWNRIPKSSSVSRFFVVFLVFLLLSSFAVLFNFVPTVKANGTPSTVGTSTALSATYWSYQRKSFYANSRFWVFYGNGTYMSFRTSTDGSSWSSATNVRSCADGDYFSVWFDGTYVHYTCAPVPQNSPIYYRRGTPNTNGTVTWSAEQTAVAAGGIATYLYDPFVSVDTNGYAWILYKKTASDYPYVTKSGNNDGTWGTTPTDFPYQLSTTSLSYWKGSIIPLTSGKMLAIYSNDAGVVRARSWNGSSWGSEVTTSNLIRWAEQHSTVAEGDDVHLVFLKASTYDILYVKYTYSTNTLGTETTVQATATSTSNPVLSRDSTTNNLYCFWAGSPTANHIYYKKCVAETWDTNPTDWITEVALKGNDRLSCFYQAYNNYIGLMWMNNTASPYQVRFDYLTISAPVTVTTTILSTESSATDSVTVWSVILVIVDPVTTLTQTSITQSVTASTTTSTSTTSISTYQTTTSTSNTISSTLSSTSCTTILATSTSTSWTTSTLQTTSTSTSLTTTTLPTTSISTSLTTTSTTSVSTSLTTSTLQTTSTSTSLTTTTLPTTSICTSLTTTTLPTTSTLTSWTTTTLPTTSTSTSLTTITTETTSTSVSTSSTTTTFPVTSISTSLTTTTFQTTSVSTSLTTTILSTTSTSTSLTTTTFQTTSISTSSTTTTFPATSTSTSIITTTVESTSSLTTTTTFQTTSISTSLTTTTSVITYDVVTYLTTLTQTSTSEITTTIVSTITTGSSTTITYAPAPTIQTGPGVAVNFFFIRVVNWQGFPIYNVTVFIRSYGLNQTSNLSTDKDGYANFQVPNDLYDVWATVDKNVVLHSTSYSSGDPANLVVLQYTWNSIAFNFLTWSPLLFPNWLWIVIIAAIAIVASMDFFVRHRRAPI